MLARAFARAVPRTGLIILAAAIACGPKADGGGTPDAGGSGGAATGGAATGGATATGGGAATGGAAAGGGAIATGGQTGSGGSAASGGRGETGGAVGSGGAAGSGGSPSSGGASSGGASVTGGSTGGGGRGGAATGGGAGTSGAGGAAGGYVCSQVTGLTLTSEWYGGGFETGVDPARWQMKCAQSAYVDEWAKPSSPFWATAVSSPCAKNSAAPDRVVFVVLSWTIMAQTDWETAITGAVTTLEAKYPGLRRIDLMTIIRGPQNQSCGDPAVYAENTRIPAALDAAIAKVAASRPALVAVAPKIEVSACSDYMGTGPHLTAAGNTKIAKLVSAHYAANP